MFYDFGMAPLLPEEIIDMILLATDFNTCLKMHKPMLATILRAASPVVLVVESEARSFVIKYRHNWIVEMKVFQSGIKNVEMASLNGLLEFLQLQCPNGMRYQAILRNERISLPAIEIYYLENDVAFRQWIKKLLQIYMSVSSIN